MRHALRLLLLAALAWAGPVPVAGLAAGDCAARPDPRLADWTVATWRARKFLVASASTTVERLPAPPWPFPSWWTGSRAAPRGMVRVTMEARLLGSGRGGRVAWSLVGGEDDPGGSRGFLVVVPGKKARAVVPGRDGAWWVRTWRADEQGRWRPPRDRRLPGNPPGAGVADSWSILADPGRIVRAAGGELALLTRKGVVRARVRRRGSARRRLTLADAATGERFTVTVGAERFSLEPLREGGPTLFDLGGPTVVEVDPAAGLLIAVEGRAEKLGRVRVRLVAVGRRAGLPAPPDWPPAGPVDADPGNP